MGERIEEIKQIILQAFPKLQSDEKFEITSKDTPIYNCIAWAYNIDNCWMWPNTGEYTFLDGVHYWPSSEIIDCNVHNFIDAFKLKGYECCDNSDLEEGYRKIALYVTSGTEICTHAARQKRDGSWTSKLGCWNDIQHGSPETVENHEYGDVYCFMKMEFK